MGAKTVQEALQQGELFTDNEKYSFLKLPIGSIAQASNVVSACSGTAFRGLLFDKDEITLMIAKSEYEKHRSSLGSDVEEGQYDYRMITFDVVMDPNLIGFMHAVTKVLAAENISVLPFAAYSRDHVFVQESHFEKAMAALEALKNDESKP